MSTLVTGTICVTLGSLFSTLLETTFFLYFLRYFSRVTVLLGTTHSQYLHLALVSNSVNSFHSEASSLPDPGAIVIIF